MVSYDDACSFGMSNRYCPPFVELTYKIVAKGKYIKSTGLAGFSMWAEYLQHSKRRRAHARCCPVELESAMS
jgi:hypothetical protein